MIPTPRCFDCLRFLPPKVPSWLGHRRSCDRFIDGACGCSVDNRWRCSPCARQSSHVTPLAAQIRAAHDYQQVVAVERVA